MTRIVQCSYVDRRGVRCPNDVETRTLGAKRGVPRCKAHPAHLAGLHTNITVAHRNVKRKEESQ